MQYPSDGDVNDEVSLFDVYEFLRDGWKTIVGLSALGLVCGVAISFVLPEKYQAIGAIESAEVAGKPVDKLQALAQKMRSPTYYSDATIAACGLSDQVGPADRLAKSLNPSVARESSYVAVSIEARTPDDARRCLGAVMEDVRRNQEPLARASRQRVQDEIRLATEQLSRATQLRDQQIALNIQRLDVAKEKLAAAERFVSEFESRIMNFDFRNDQFSASSLLLATLQSKQNEVKDLQIQIDELDMKVKAKITSEDEFVFEFGEKVAELRESLAPPFTRDADFATPIYAPETRVSPKRGLITVVSLLAGGFLALVILIGRRAIRHIREHEAARDSRSV